MLLSLDDHDAVTRDAAIGQRKQAHLQHLGQRRSAHVETQLNGARYLVRRSDRRRPAHEPQSTRLHSTEWDSGMSWRSKCTQPRDAVRRGRAKTGVRVDPAPRNRRYWALFFFSFDGFCMKLRPGFSGRTGRQFRVALARLSAGPPRLGETRALARLRRAAVMWSLVELARVSPRRDALSVMVVAGIVLGRRRWRSAAALRLLLLRESLRVRRCRRGLPERRSASLAADFLPCTRDRRPRDGRRCATLRSAMAGERPAVVSSMRLMTLAWCSGSRRNGAASMAGNDRADRAVSRDVAVHRLRHLRSVGSVDAALSPDDAQARGGTGRSGAERELRRRGGCSGSDCCVRREAPSTAHPSLFHTDAPHR